MLPYALTIFLSAFLLFLVQPLIAKQILPWFGGAASVWTTCLLFFQSALLAGYAYADASVRWLRPRQQVYVHAALMLLSLALLPILANSSWKPSGNEEPILCILGLLTVTIGLPYLLLSTTTPLLQAWYWRRFNASVPYRLFALSNFASLLALLGYPVLIEPYFGVTASANLWSLMYGLFVVVCGLTGFYSIRNMPADADVSRKQANDADAPAAKTPTSHLLLWLLLSAMGSCVLLAVSNHITQNIASVPFLWVLPLALYLLTFIICFDQPRWYVRGLFMPLLAVSVLGMAWMIDSLELAYAAPLFALGLFAACMFCHGELARSKPDAAHLTEFFLMISAGGVLGGLLVAVLAPMLLPGLFELGIGLVVVGVLALLRTWREPIWIASLFGAGVLFSSFCVWRQVDDYGDNTLRATRDFYGALRVLALQGEDGSYRSLRHGSIMHGAQWITPPERSSLPITYYGPRTGLALAIQALPEDSPRKLGMIGLGSGTLAAWGRRGDIVKFYEISPKMVDIARNQFRYLSDSAAQIEIVVGDARLSLESESPQQFDVLAVDAFSGDAIPIHLLTPEAMDVYLRHLKPGGALLFHVTNRFLDLPPVVRALADARGLVTGLVSHSETDEEDRLHYASTDWMIVTANPALLETPAIKRVIQSVAARPDLRSWSDDFNNLYRILK